MKKTTILSLGIAFLTSTLLIAQSPERVKSVTVDDGFETFVYNYHYANSTDGFINTNLPKLDLHKFYRTYFFDIDVEFGYTYDQIFMTPFRHKHIGIDYEITGFGTPLTISNSAVAYQNGNATTMNNTGSSQFEEYTFRTFYQYNAQNQVTSIVLETFEDGEYDTVQIHAFTYENGLEKTHSLIYHSNNGPGNPIVDSMVYDGQSRIVEYHQMETGLNIDFHRTISMSYSGSFLSEFTEHVISDGQVFTHQKTILTNNGNRFSGGHTMEWDGTTLGDTVAIYEFEGTPTRIDEYRIIDNIADNEGNAYVFEYLNDSFLTSKATFGYEDVTYTPESTITYTYGGELNVEKTSIINVSVYPNPTTDFVHVSADEKIDEIIVYNSLGQVVLAQSGQSTVDLSALAAGNYQLEVRTMNGNHTSTIVKD